MYFAYTNEIIKDIVQSSS